MTRNGRTIRIISIAILFCLYGCASPTIAVRSCPQAAPLSQEQQIPAPPPLAFSQCLAEILAVGRGQQAQISAPCSALLGPLPTP